MDVIPPEMFIFLIDLYILRKILRGEKVIGFRLREHYEGVG